MERIIYRNDFGKTFEILVGDTLVINLPEIPTTGYRWTIDDINYQIVEYKNSHSITRNEGIGGGENRIFELRAKSLGKTKIRFIEKREWEPNDVYVDEFEVVVDVRSNTV